MNNMNCPICIQGWPPERRTTWYWEGEDYVIIECDTCHVTMALYRYHREPPESVREEIIERLGRVANEVLGDYRIDWKRRKIPSHPHWHARPIT